MEVEKEIIFGIKLAPYVPFNKEDQINTKKRRALALFFARLVTFFKKT
jgi:hypothetical protein